MDSYNQRNYKYLYNKYKTKYNNLKNSQSGGGVLQIYKTGDYPGSENVIKTNFNNIVDFKKHFTNPPFDDEKGRQFYNKIATSNGIIYQLNQPTKKESINLSKILDAQYKDTNTIPYAIEVDEPTYKAFEFLCAHSKPTKIFTKCGTAYNYN